MRICVTSARLTSTALLLLFQAGTVAMDDSMAAESRASQPGLDAAATEKVTRLAHVQLTSTGISDAYAKAISRTVEAARAVAVEQFGFDIPETIQVRTDLV